MKIQTAETNSRAIRLYHHIADYMAANQRPPTVREVSGMLGVTSTATARHYLGVLRKWHWVDWQYHQVRTLRLTRTAVVEVHHE